MELEPPANSANEVVEAPDLRPRMEVPPAVRLVSVDDVRFDASANVERELDVFYVLYLGFEREDIIVRRPKPSIQPLLGGDRTGITPPPLALGFSNQERAVREEERRLPRAIPPQAERQKFDAVPGPIYRAANFRLRFRWVAQPIAHDGLRPQGVEVDSLSDVMSRFIEAQVKFERVRGLLPGQECLLTQDPAGNWLEVVESRPV